MTDLQRFAWAFSVIVAVALTVLLLGLLMAGPAEATTEPSPSPTATEPAPAPSCDPYQGYRDITLPDGSPGCVLEVQAEPETFQAGVFGIAAGLLVVTATLFVTAARKG